MAITNAIMQVRRGLEADFDPEKMHPGEWAVSTDTKYVRMCFAPGTCVRMATYEAFEEDMGRIEVIYADFKDAELDIVAAENSANLSKSYAVGGTGTRDNEDTDNAKYYSEKAKESADKLDTMTVDVLTNQLGEMIVGDVNIKYVAFGNGVFVGVSDTSKKTYLSTDGINWSDSGGTLESGANTNGIVYGNGIFVVVHTSGTYEFSTDGINWTSKNIGNTNSLVCVAYGKEKFIIGDISGNLYSSTDGINFAEESSLGSRVRSFCFANDLFVVGTNGGVYYSTDGTTWIATELTSMIVSVTYGNNMFVASASGEKTMYYSADGVTWLAGGQTDKAITFLSYGNGIFIGSTTSLNTTGATIYHSKDGISWSVFEEILPKESNIASVDYLHKGLFLIGNSGTSYMFRYIEFLKESLNVKDLIQNLYSKVNHMPYVLVPISSANWTASTEYTGYGYVFEQSIEDYYDVFPEWFLKPLSGIVPTQAEQTAFENIAAMKLDISDTSNPKLKFYAATQPTTDILVLVKGVQ